MNIGSDLSPSCLISNNGGYWGGEAGGGGGPWVGGGEEEDRGVAGEAVGVAFRYYW